MSLISIWIAIKSHQKPEIGFSWVVDSCMYMMLGGIYNIKVNFLRHNNARPPFKPMRFIFKPCMKPSFIFTRSTIRILNFVSIWKTMAGFWSSTRRQRSRTIRGFPISRWFQLMIFIVIGRVVEQPSLEIVLHLLFHLYFLFYFSSIYPYRLPHNHLLIPFLFSVSILMLGYFVWLRLFFSNSSFYCLL